MNRKKVLQDIALRLKKIRETLGFSAVDMTKRIGTYRTNYYKYESAASFPHFTVLARLGNNLGVSLDWLILDKGPMFYKENRKINAIANAAPAAVLNEVAGSNNTSLEEADHVEKLQVGHENVKRVSWARIKYTEAIGMEQVATDRRNRLLAEFNFWMKEFIYVCKAALKNEPQILEVLGIQVLSDGYRRQIPEVPTADGADFAD